MDSGALLAVTAITYDSSYYGEVATLPIKRAWDGCYVDLILPPVEPPLYENGIVYDYFFLYLEPMSGNPVLNLNLQRNFNGKRASENRYFSESKIGGITWKGIVRMGKNDICL